MSSAFCQHENAPSHSTSGLLQIGNLFVNNRLLSWLPNTGSPNWELDLQESRNSGPVHYAILPSDASHEQDARATLVDTGISATWACPRACTCTGHVPEASTAGICHCPSVEVKEQGPCGPYPHLPHFPQDGRTVAEILTFPWTHIPICWTILCHFHHQTWSCAPPLSWN